MFNTIFIQPLLNLLFGIYALIPGHDFGVAVILLTALVRLLLWPLAQKQLHSQKRLTQIQPEVNKLKERYKNDMQKFNAAVMELYKEKEVNPFSSCLPTLLQFPFLIALFYVFIKFQDPNFVKIVADYSSGITSQLYPALRDWQPINRFIVETSVVDTRMFGLIDLAKPFLLFGVVAGVSQFIQTKMITPKNQEKSAATAMTNQMLYFFPILTVAISLTLPAALPLYWTVTTLFAIGQQYLVMRTDVERLEDKSERKSNKKS